MSVPFSAVDVAAPLAEPDVLCPEPSPAGLSSALAWLEGLAQRDGWPARTLFALTLCADEALTNVVSYASAPAGGAAPAPAVVSTGPPGGGRPGDRGGRAGGWK